jgi:hypothetical protein
MIHYFIIYNIYNIYNFYNFYYFFYYFFNYIWLEGRVIKIRIYKIKYCVVI